MNPKNSFKLTRGDRGQFVRSLQTALLEKGVSIQVDGVLGRITIGHANKILKLSQDNKWLSHGQLAELGVNIKLGIDLSGHNEGGTKDAVNFDKAKRDGVDFVIVKLTQDRGYVNDEAFRQVHEAARVMMPCGPYHFPDLTRGYDPKNGPAKDAEAEFEHFLAMKNRAAPSAYWTIRPWLDIENGINAVRSKAEDTYNASWYVHWLRLASNESKMRAGSYTARWAEDAYFQNAETHLVEELGDSPLWLASYNHGVQPARMPDTWSDVAIWQFTSKGSIDGIDGNVDLNWSLEEDLLGE